MRRLAAVLAFVGFTLALVAVPATGLAQTTSPTTPQGGGPNPLVSGPFTGTGTFSYPGQPEVYVGTYIAVKNGRTGSFQVDGSITYVTAPYGPYPFTGTFTLTAPNGATMNGTAAGAIDPLPNRPFSITLTPTGGTGKFANVGGVVNLTATWQSYNVLGVPGPISGSLAGALTH